MATTGAYLTDPTLSDFADECFERAGIAPQSIEGEKIASFRRSVGFALSRWANKGHRHWKFGTLEHTTAVGETVFELPAGVIDVQTVTLKRDGIETPMVPISRSDYRLLHDKTLKGRPVSYFVNRRRNTDANTRPQMFYWFAGENDTDQIIVEYYMQGEDVGDAGAGTLDVPFRFQDAIAAEVAARLAEKFNPQRYRDLRATAEQFFREAAGEDTEKAALIVSVDYSARGRRRW